MKTVWKYTLSPFRSTRDTFQIPRGATILHVALDPADMTGNDIAFWAEVDTAEAPEPRDFEIVGTGHHVPENAVYHGTVMWGRLIFHLYERMSKPAPPST